MQLQFNLYGLVVGIAIVVGLQLIERKINKTIIEEKFFYRITIFSLVFAILGARIWHVVTDFYLYSGNLKGIFQIWNGGLSILGGVLGGMIGLFIVVFWFSEFKFKPIKEKKDLIYTFLDTAIFGLPVGQAIGRWANYINQELYGKPTNFFLKIFIDPDHRLTGYENIEYYHPLFFYEMIFTGLFAAGLYLVNCKKKWAVNIQDKLRIRIPKIGTGKLFGFYVFYYSIVRFFLDFLRIDRSGIFGGLGKNQWVLLVIICIFLLIRQINTNRK